MEDGAAAVLLERWAADRRRVATVLHDDVVQSMSTALMAVGLLRMDLPDEPAVRDAEIALANSAVALRQLLSELAEPPAPQ